MPAIDQVEVLRTRAEQFLRHAVEALERGEYDLSCFFTQQSTELLLKALVLRITGQVPRLHSVRYLLALLLKLLEELGVGAEVRTHVVQFCESRREVLKLMDEVYVEAQYTAKRYEREDAEKLVNLCREIWDLVRRVEEVLYLAP